MTTLVKNPRARRGSSTPMAIGLPQVNLLPPEGRAARGLRATQRLLVVALAAVLAVCVGGFAFGQMQKASANKELAAAQETTRDLQAQQAKYSEVPIVLGALAETVTSIQYGLSTEVQWKKYLDGITSVLPDDASLDSYVVVAPSPLVPAAPPTDPLQDPSVGQINFAVRSATLPDTAALLNALNGISSFGDAWVSNATLASDDNGDYYTVSASVQVHDSAYSGRGLTIEGKD
jgi:Tfp pilus assembly protein PilN